MSPPPAAQRGFFALDVAADPEWQMHLGERFALEGLLRSLQPRLSIEIGRAEGGSLRRIAAHSGLTHSFDLVPEPAALREAVDNVVFRTGDSSVQVPETLRSLGEEGREVNFALVDGDHSADGVRRDAEALLAADACRNTAIVFHDAANDDVRAGLEAVGFAEHPKVRLAMLDFVPGFLVEHGPYAMQIWNGLGLVVLGEDAGDHPTITEPWRFDAAEMARLAREAVGRRSAPAAPAPSGRAGTARVAALAAATGAAAAALGTALRHRG